MAIKKDFKASMIKPPRYSGGDSGYTKEIRRRLYGDFPAGVEIRCVKPGELVTIRYAEMMEMLEKVGMELYANSNVVIDQIEIHPELMALINKSTDKMRYSPKPESGSEVMKMNFSWGPIHLKVNPRMTPDKVLAYGKDFVELIDVACERENHEYRGASFGAAIIDETIPEIKKEEEIDFMAELKKL